MKFEVGDKVVPNGTMKQNACMKLCDIAEVTVIETGKHLSDCTFIGTAKLKRFSWYLSGYRVHNEIEELDRHYFKCKAFTLVRDKESYNIY